MLIYANCLSKLKEGMLSLCFSLQELDFPVSLLPEVYDPSHIAGHTQTCWYGIPENTPVGVAMGDLQCSILSRLQEASDAGQLLFDFSINVLYAL